LSITNKLKDFSLQHESVIQPSPLTFPQLDSEEALQKYGPPQIFNTDQGSQFTCNRWITVLEENDIKISMDGKGRWMDNVFIERLWRSLKYECIFI